MQQAHKDRIMFEHNPDLVMAQQQQQQQLQLQQFPGQEQQQFPGQGGLFPQAVQSPFPQAVQSPFPQQQTQTAIQGGNPFKIKTASDDLYNFKTTLCQAFIQTMQCARGDKCCFA